MVILWPRTSKLWRRKNTPLIWAAFEQLKALSALRFDNVREVDDQPFVLSGETDTSIRLAGRTSSLAIGECKQTDHHLGQLGYGKSVTCSGAGWRKPQRHNTETSRALLFGNSPCRLRRALVTNFKTAS